MEGQREIACECYEYKVPGDQRGPLTRTRAVLYNNATAGALSVAILNDRWSLSGENKPWGDDSLEGAKMAVAEVNAAGGINGKQVELLVQDDASTPEGGKSAAEKLLSQGVVELLGEVSSSITIQIANSAFEKNVPVVDIGGTKPEITDIGSNIFRVCYTDDFQGPVMAQFAYEELGLRNVALMTDNQQAYSQGLSKTFKEHFEKLGGKIVDEEKYNTSDTAFQGQLNAMKAKNPDGVFMSGYFTQVGPIAQQARAAGIKAKFLGGDGWDSPTLLDSGGNAIIGGYMCNHYNNKEDRPEVKEFLAKWKKAHGGKEPGTTMAALGYDAAAVGLNAIKNAKSPDTAGIIAALDETENFKAVSGTITLKGGNGNPTKQALVVEIRPLSEGFQVFRKAYTPDMIK
ncbi:ABC transporter substrate-binding protein [bacterium]|nr:MAG: ABC transporter substrate-binding protein [bacterium]